jgi:hypothetical protein
VESVNGGLPGSVDGKQDLMEYNGFLQISTIYVTVLADSQFTHHPGSLYHNYLSGKNAT